MPPPISAQKELCEHGSFVLLEPGWALLASGEPWTVLAPRATRRSLEGPLLRCQDALEKILLPSSLGGLRFLPTALSGCAFQVMRDWRVAFDALEEHLHEHARELVEGLAVEQLASLFVRCRRKDKAFASSAGGLRERLLSLAGDHLVFEPPTLCPIEIATGAPRDDPALADLVSSFIAASRAETARRVVRALETAAGRGFLYKSCTDGVFYSRRYYARHIGCLPVESWEAWFTAFRDEPAAELVHRLRWSIPKLDPGRTPSVKLCKFLGVVAGRLAELIPDGEPSIGASSALLR